MKGDLERSHYEADELWSAERFTDADRRRAADTVGWVPEEARSVLDAGCGNGLLTRLLARGRFAVGVDRSRYALGRFDGLRSQVDVAALPFADAAFDCVVCTEVIEHLPQAAYPAVLNELARVARRYILITVPYCEDLLAGHVTCPACGCRFNANYHLRSFDEPALRALYAGRPGVRLVRMAGLNPEPARRLGRLWTTLLLLRYDLLGAPDLAPHMQCPRCGYRRGPAGRAAPPSAAPRLGLAALAGYP